MQVLEKYLNYQKVSLQIYMDSNSFIEKKNQIKCEFILSIYLTQFTLNIKYKVRMSSAKIYTSEA